jgi:steroid delta-isomerase-like uncharacterized protein
MARHWRPQGAVFAPWGGTAGAAMTKEETTRFFDRWRQAWAAQDVTALANLYASDCKVTSPMFGPMQGRAAVAESFKRLFKAFPDWKLKTEQLIIDNDRAAIVFSTDATHSADFMGLPATGRKAKVSGVLVQKLDDDLIEEELRLYDFTALLVQVGVLRAKPGH